LTIFDDIYFLVGLSPNQQLQTEVQRWEYEHEIDRLKSELNQMKIEHAQKESQWQQTELCLETALAACQQQLAECEQRLKTEQFAQQLESEKLKNTQPSQDERAEVRSAFQLHLLNSTVR
jgi:hypothetical protein